MSLILNLNVFILLILLVNCFPTEKPFYSYGKSKIDYLNNKNKIKF
jgi:hypothetical protein